MLKTVRVYLVRHNCFLSVGVSKDVIICLSYFYHIPDLWPWLFFFQVEQNRVKLLNDQAVAKSQLQKKLGQFLYLTNLEKVIYIL